MKKKKAKRIKGEKKIPVRANVPPPTIWHKDDSKYSRKKKHKNGETG